MILQKRLLRIRLKEYTNDLKRHGGHSRTRKANVRVVVTQKEIYSPIHGQLTGNPYFPTSKFSDNSTTTE